MVEYPTDLSLERVDTLAMWLTPIHRPFNLRARSQVYPREGIR
jgi:hypothetical protein